MSGAGVICDIEGDEYQFSGFGLGNRVTYMRRCPEWLDEDPTPAMLRKWASLART